MKKKLLAVFVTVAMLLTMVPTVFAVGEAGSTGTGVVIGTPVLAGGNNVLFPVQVDGAYLTENDIWNGESLSDQNTTPTGSYVITVYWIDSYGDTGDLDAQDYYYGGGDHCFYVNASYGIKTLNSITVSKVTASNWVTENGSSHWKAATEVLKTETYGTLPQTVAVSAISAPDAPFVMAKGSYTMGKGTDGKTRITWPAVQLTSDYSLATVSDLTVTSDHPEIVRVYGSNNNLQAVAAGTAAITLTDKSGKVSDTFTVVVPNYAVDATTTVAAAEQDGSNGAPFRTLDAALAAAQPGETIALFSDVATTTAWNIQKEITLELNGHILAYSGKDSSKDAAINVTTANGKLTVNDSSTAGTGKITSDYYWGICVAAGAALTVNGGTIQPSQTLDSAAISGNGNPGNGGTSITINGGTVQGSPVAYGCGIYHPQDGKLTINGGTISGGTALEVKAGTVTINGNNTTIASTATGHTANSNGSSTTGYAVAVVENKAYTGNAAVTIAGGTFTGPVALIKDSDNTAYTYKLTVTGGKFSDLSAIPYYDNASAITLTVSTPEALTSALALGTGNTIVLGKNIDMGTQSLTVAAGNVVTLDLNGYTLSGTDAGAVSSQLILNKGTLTVRDTSAAKGGRITLTATTNRGYTSFSAVISNQGGSVTVDSGSLIHTGGTDMAFAVDNISTVGNARLSVNGGTLQSTYCAVRNYQNSTSYSADITVNGGALTGSGSRAVYLQQPTTDQAGLGTLTVKSGTFTSGKVTLYAEMSGVGGTVMNITGGTFTSNAGSVIMTEMEHPLGKNCKITISGGTFTCTDSTKPVIRSLNFTDGEDPSLTNMAISGGTFSNLPDASYLESGKAFVKSGATYTVGNAAAAAAAVADITTTEAAANKELINNTVAAIQQTAATELAKELESSTPAITQEKLASLDELYVAANTEAATGKVVAPAVEAAAAATAGLEVKSTAGLALSTPVEAGKTTQAVLTVAPVAAEKVEAVKTAAVAAINTSTDADVVIPSTATMIPLDISLNIKTNETVDAATVQPKAPIVITTTIPAALADKADSIRILHVHDNVTEVLTPTIDKAAGTMSFTATSFSSYIITNTDPANTNTYTLEMSVADGTYKVGNTLPVSVKLKADAAPTANVDRVDLFVSYDQTHLAFTGSTDSAMSGFTVTKVTDGLLELHYDNPTGMNINTTGVTLPTLKFTALAVGTAAAFELQASYNGTDAEITNVGYQFGARRISITNAGLPAIVPGEDNDAADSATAMSITASAVNDGQGNATGGSVTLSRLNAEKGDTVTVTPKADAGYQLSTLVVTDANGNNVAVTKNADGTYSFVMPAAKVTVKAVFAAALPFADVPANYWAMNEIRWAYQNGYMNGKTTALFQPTGTVTRQQLWMVLARLSGANPASMAEARTWAMTNNVSDGSDPTNAVSRQQMVTILYRYAQTFRGLADEDTGSMGMAGFSDASSVAQYAYAAMHWGVRTGIIQGDGDKLNPTGNTTRAEFAVILYRFCQNLGK